MSLGAVLPSHVLTLSFQLSTLKPQYGSQARTSHGVQPQLVLVAPGFENRWIKAVFPW